MKDACGNDAIWIQEENAAMGAGHSGLMVQDENGDWFFFYWGPNSETPSKELVLGVDNGSYFVRIDTYGADLNDTASVKTAIANSGDVRASARASEITKTYYFEGDYTATYHKAKEMSTSNDKYYLLSKNCSQQTLRAFGASDSRFYDVSYGDWADIVPNYVASKVAMLPSKKGKFALKLWLYNLFIEDSPYK